ncbi:hypothetical protein [Bacillus licheniformis]|uniref:Uncharacterized protein n=1 Tax=Bacillus licheniformis TaxID=1402 RepID=A0A8B5Y7Q8_BACLI|nr:hypothetical protein [Bacillus licheniformis]TWL22246.1 hypothetical protein CHCC16736_3715 [Bacillus licheniformis]TWL31428.1 hypothetical protein CHCC15543_3705 [Bacillus licheniformis]WCO63699.1 hypothetical protein OSR41_04960 [Bacillus licheniformis]
MDVEAVVWCGLGDSSADYVRTSSQLSQNHDGSFFGVYDEFVIMSDVSFE